jgi:type I restriction enzyme S subunit
MKIKHASLGKFVVLNPEGITHRYPYQAIEYIDISSVGSGQLIEQPEEILLKDAPSRAKRIVRNNDTILATVRPNLRSFLFIKNPNNNTIVSTGFAVLRAKETANPRFIYYCVSDKKFTGYLANNTKGTSYPAVDSDIILRGKIPNFDLNRQQNISDFLSTYDDLIDTNRRRVQLLEESARLLFREWFVYFRFPRLRQGFGGQAGHEKACPVESRNSTGVKIVGGVPEGWEKKPLGGIAPLKYGKALKEGDRVPGSVPVFGSSGIVGTHNKALVSGPAIIVGRKGNVGSVYWSENDFWPIDTVYFVESDSCTLYLYYALLHVQFISTDVAVPGLNRELAHSRQILWPEAGILRLFEEFVAPLYEQIATLRKTNESLAQARDLLLPRLMSGAIEV